MSADVEKKVEKTPEEKHAEMVERSLDLQRIASEMFRKTKIVHEKIEKEIRHLKKENESLLKLVTKKFQDQGAILSKTRRVSENTEETLLNVLLAIRQNEYLQAWYPEQNGFQAMKVSGIHPSKHKAAV